MSSVNHLRQLVNERLTAAAEEIFGVIEKTIVEYEEEIDRQRRLLDIIWKPDLKLHRIEVKFDHEEEQEVLSDPQLCKQERISSLDQEEPEPPQIKKNLFTDQQEDELGLKQEKENFMLISTFDESYQSEDKILDSCPGGSQSLAEENPVVHITAQIVDSSSVGTERPGEEQICIRSVDGMSPQSDDVPASNSDNQLLSSSPVDESRNHTATEHDPHVNNVLKSTMLKRFSSVSSMTRHGKIHTGEKPYPSNYCGQRCRDPVQLRKHEMIHTGEKPYTCNHCGKGFKENLSLKIHQRTHTDEKPYPCITCGKRFKIGKSLRIHTRIHTGEKPYPCNSCGKRFRDSTQRRQHERVHTGEKPYPCNHCGKRFRSISTRKAHRRTHTGERPYPCNTCGKRFSSKYTQQTHVMIHTGVKPYPCSICEKGFRSTTGLVRHMRVHLDEKPYECKTCGKRFRDSSSRRTHDRSHTGEKPYACKTCGKRYGYSASLRKHERNHTC